MLTSFTNLVKALLGLKSSASELQGACLPVKYFTRVKGPLIEHKVFFTSELKVRELLSNFKIPNGPNTDNKSELFKVLMLEEINYMLEKCLQLATHVMVSCVEDKCKGETCSANRDEITALNQAMLDGLSLHLKTFFTTTKFTPSEQESLAYVLPAYLQSRKQAHSFIQQSIKSSFRMSEFRFCAQTYQSVVFMSVKTAIVVLGENARIAYGNLNGFLKDISFAPAGPRYRCPNWVRAWGQTRAYWNKQFRIS